MEAEKCLTQNEKIANEKMEFESAIYAKVQLLYVSFSLLCSQNVYLCKQSFKLLMLLTITALRNLFFHMKSILQFYKSLVFDILTSKMLVTLVGENP